MKTLKLQALKWVTSKLGPLITPLISGVVGTLIGTIYAWLGDMLAKVPSLQAFFANVWTSLDPATQAALHPMAIGAIVAGATYMLIQELMNKYFIGEVAKDQISLNKVLPPDEHLKVDGFPGEKTRAAKVKVLGIVKRGA